MDVQTTNPERLTRAGTAIVRRAEKRRQEIESPLSGSRGGSFDLEKSRLLLVGMLMAFGPIYAEADCSRAM